jgi:hypothetical protein
MPGKSYSFLKTLPALLFAYDFLVAVRWPLCDATVTLPGYNQNIIESGFLYITEY